MDPTARRETWEIIKEAKKDKIIILTTHYMDEAEYLADRVAVVSRGALKICGTTSFLKEKFGHYFYLEVDPTKNQAEGSTQLLQLLESYNQKHFHERHSSSPENHLILTEETASVAKNQNDFSPITKTVDEAGKVVYKLAHYMSSQFGPIF